MIVIRTSLIESYPISHIKVCRNFQINTKCCVSVRVSLSDEKQNKNNKKQKKQQKKKKKTTTTTTTKNNNNKTTTTTKQQIQYKLDSASCVSVSYHVSILQQASGVFTDTILGFTLPDKPTSFPCFLTGTVPKRNLAWDKERRDV